MSKPSRRPNREARKTPKARRCNPAIGIEITGKRDYELKFARAFQHLDTLRSDIARWERDSYRLVNELDSNNGETVQYIEVSEDPPTRAWGLVIGECVHSLRSCLDYLALDLAKSHKASKPLPAKIEEGSEFPIYWKNPIPPDVKKKKIGAIDPSAQAIIEGLQPHLRGADFWLDPLWRINELDRIDKHRLITAVVFAHKGSSLKFNHGYIKNATFGLNMGEIRKGRTEINRFSIEPIDGRMDMKIDPVIEITFQGVPELKDTPVLSTLDDIFSYLDAKVFKSLRPFLK